MCARAARQIENLRKQVCSRRQRATTMELRSTLVTQAVGFKAGARTWVQLWRCIQCGVGCPAMRRVKSGGISYAPQRHGNAQWRRNALLAFCISTPPLLYVGKEQMWHPYKDTLPKAAAHSFSAATARARISFPSSLPNITICFVSHVVATHLSYVCRSARQLYLQCIMGATALYVSVQV